LNRVGQLTPSDGLTSFKATLRLNNVGSWQIDVPEGRPLADALRAPGSGIVVTNAVTGQVVISGPTVAATKTSESGEAVALWSIRGADDTVLLAERLAYPTPTSADVTAQTAAYDAVSATKASTAMIGYVRRNLVSGVAPAARAVTGVTTYADPGVGSFISYAARFDVLGQVCSDIANVDGLAFDMYQNGTSIVFKVWQPTDLSKTVRLDIANNTLQKSTYGYGYGISRAIVGGQGEGAARTFTEVSTSASLQTESSFGRRVERFVDQRQEADSAKLTVAGQSTLADSGGLITSVDVVPTSDTTMRPLVDFNLGDKVSVVVAAQEVSAVITQLSMSVTDMGVYVGITVGNPVGVDFDAITAKRATDSTARVSNLETLDNVAVSGSKINASDITQGQLPAAQGGHPTGAYMYVAGRKAPTGYLACDGASYSRSTYSALATFLCEPVGTVTISLATPGVFTSSVAHGFVAGDRVYLTTTGALPTGLSAYTVYYVIASGLTSTTFQLSTSAGGGAIATSGTQSGTHSLVYSPYETGSVSSSNFKVPDNGDYVLSGVKAGSAEFGSVGQAYGAKTVQLSVQEMPSHTHVQDAHGHTYRYGYPAGGDGSALASSGTSGTSGSTSVAGASRVSGTPKL
jgi:microcystin-dependent protein